MKKLALSLPRPSRRRLMVGMAAVGIGHALGPGLGAAWAQTAWPNRRLRLLVGFPPGSSPDLMARTLAEPLA